MNSSPTSDPWIGRLLGDLQRYRLEKRIGAGGMGDVFLAMDTLLGQQVALKLLKDTLATAGNLRKRFEREISLCAALASDHIVQVRDCGVTTEGYPFYIMEYLRGESLGQLLRRQKKLPVERTIQIIRQVCVGLQLAHKGVTLWRDGATTSEHIQIVHRDLKPDNIFLIPTELGELVKILDFGIAKICDEAAEFTNLTSTFLGTFRYAAPEQLQGEQNIDGRADIYSLGIILYEMLSGSDPFGFGVKARSTSGVTWGMAHASKLPQPLRSQPDCDRLPAELEAIVMRCLRKSPDERFQSVEELSQALQSLMSALGRIANSGSDSTGQLIDQTIVQTPSAPPKAESLDQTINRPLTPPKPIPDETSVQIRSAPAFPEALDQTSDRPLTPPKPIPDETRVQIPAAKPQPQNLDNTLVQIPSEQSRQDAMNARSAVTPKRQTPDATIVQTSPSQSATRDVTLVQLPASKQISEATIAQVNPQLEQKVDPAAISNTTKTQKPDRRLSPYLLFGTGIIAILVAIGAIFTYFNLQKSTQSSDPSDPPPTQSTFDACKENPNSLFCSN